LPLLPGEDFVVLPYLINDQLKKKKKQPKFIKEESFQKLDVNLDISGDTHFMKVCRKGKLQRQKFKSKELNCRMIHHGDPYLKLGPFKEEQASEYPYAVIFHDIFSDYETNLLIRQATPHLSRKRNTHADKSDVLAKHEFKDGKKTQIVHKTVQAWMKEVEWPVLYEGDKYVKINSPTLWKLTKRIGLATNLKTTGRFSGTPMQVTNYGLGGLCAAHVDPHGYIEGVELTPSRQDLIDTGDMFGTFMAWLDDVEAGGGTAYLEPGYQGVLMPKKGAAAFWYDLSAHGHRDFSTQHGGCPVLKGSKWIMNKWIFYYDNWNKYPCHLTKNTRVKPPGTHHYF
jgi:prolyl 4-hydroxylase